MIDLRQDELAGWQEWLYIEEGLTINQIAIIPGMNDNHGIVHGVKPSANGFTWNFDGVDDYINFGTPDFIDRRHLMSSSGKSSKLSRGD